MKSKYYWLMGLGGAASVVLVSGLAMANLDKSYHRGKGGDHSASHTHEKGKMAKNMDADLNPCFMP